MIKLNRTSEYGLMALKHMSRKSPTVTSAREIADSYSLPFEITAKTLQRLKDSGLIRSAQGARGGYTLNRPLEEITLSEFLRLMEGEQSIVACASAVPVSGLPSAGCEYTGKCELKHLMGGLNARVQAFLAGIQLSEIAGPTQGKIE
jgi:Rrf2 family protein